LKRLLLQLDPHARLSQFTGVEIEFEKPESDNSRIRRSLRHPTNPVKVYTRLAIFLLDEPSHNRLVYLCFQWISWSYSFPSWTMSALLFCLDKLSHSRNCVARKRRG
jgi:hypothetical protein